MKKYLKFAISVAITLGCFWWTFRGVNKDELLDKMDKMQMGNEELGKELERLKELFKQMEVENMLEQQIDKLEELAKEQEQAPEFVKARRTHSAVESAINGLEVHGLDVCPDHGIEGFRRYVALAVLTRNIHRIGVILWSQDIERAQRKSRYADPDMPAKLAA